MQIGIYCSYFVSFGVTFCIKDIFVISSFLFYFKLLKFVKKKKIRRRLNTFIWPIPVKIRQSFKKIGLSFIPSKSVQLLWWTLIEVFFDHLQT